jgi:uncharacterized protein YlxW (UPF0749 family)
VRVIEPHSHRAPDEEVPRWPERIRHAMRQRYTGLRSHGTLWLVLTPVVFILAGGLFVTSGISSAGTDLRPERYDDLADLAEARSQDAAELNDQQAKLQAEVDQLTRTLQGTAIKEANEQVDRLRGPAGLVPVTGPGLTVTLTDAPEVDLEDPELKPDESVDPNQKLVHEQDIQAVANALWAGGAEAVTVRSQRVISTTGIRCVGNTVLLHGVTYSPPYVIAAIGDPEAMLDRLYDDPYLKLYLRDVERFQLGWDVQADDALSFPAYDGPVELEYARPEQPDESA